MQNAVITSRGRLVLRRLVASGSPFEKAIGFSRAVRVGDRVLVSGTGPVWPDGSCSDDAAVQARRCFEITAEALAQAGASLTDVVRTRMFLVDPFAADAVGAVHGELFAEIRPAATIVIVAGLLDPRWKVEIEAEAVVAGPT
ncbi:MAG: RidA family protein [Actinomycetota bacterium]|nr:RidA family protein [Actinomycetota bacterium]